MTMWSDNRNHLLDDVLHDLFFVLVALAIGVAPGQFVAIVVLTQLSESFQHANVRVWFGQIGERMWVSPRFHRLHHSVGIGHETISSRADDTKPVRGGHNFGVLLPWWDMLFGTADFSLRYDPTGVRNQLEQGVDYGRGFWSQQWRGLQRLWNPPCG
jgi:sterol desaturase/sphingolipid hydroxylase (fatty acid hydroxylase superfamily)